MLEAEQLWKFWLREQWVGASVISIDHTLKFAKAQNVEGHKAGKNRGTVWSNNHNCPLISLSLETTSMSDPALKKAVRAYLEVAMRDGRALPMPVKKFPSFPPV